MRRYYSFNQYLKETFPGHRIYKIPVHAGLTCPNRDGKAGTGGCIYCDNRSFSPNTRQNKPLSIKSQVEEGMKFYRTRHQADKFIVYFQSFSNTYAPIEKLRQLYDEATGFPDVVGLSIGTRPDCVSEETISLISKYTKKYLVWMEYGIQSIHNKTLDLINRGHTYDDFAKAVNITKGKGIKIATHIILGLPGETKNDMIKTAQQVGLLGLDGIKIHHLYVAKNTALENRHNESKVKLLTLGEYIPLVCDILENLPEGMVIQRLVGELSESYAIAPAWNVPKAKILSMIEAELDTRGSYQGRLFPKMPR
ncbi:MAG: TIGR01212 family radical SAM protein [Planctomycetes bacterium]|nr:TIGR01212 family radical SAM protein [Planctomycetota bacterium]